jgi:hypothetical protein
MAKNTTLKDLNAFLKETGETKGKVVKTAEDFINSKPNSIGETKKIKNEEALGLKLTEANTGDIVLRISDLAKDRGMSYAEVCMELLEKGSEYTQILKGGGVVTTWMSANKTAFNVLKNVINKHIKG